MDMMAADRRTSSAAAKWSERVKKLGESGLTLGEFAKREKVNAGTLSFWKWKLARREGGRARGSRVEPLKFVELTAATPSAAAPVPSFEVVLRSGRTVRVPGGFDAAALARLVNVLEEARS
jgi:hypothetical protein